MLSIRDLGTLIDRPTTYFDLKRDNMVEFL